MPCRRRVGGSIRGAFLALIGARPTQPGLGATLTRAAAAGDGADDILKDLNPPHYGYQQLREKLMALRSPHAPDGIDRLVDATDALSITDSPPASRKSTRRRMAANGGSPSHIEAEIIANMERWRWLPRELGAARVEINIPEFELAVVRDGAVTHRTKVIVGKEDTPTPIFSNALQFIIVNPYWNVPQSIINKEMLPKHGGDLSYSPSAAGRWPIAMVSSACASRRARETRWGASSSCSRMISPSTARHAVAGSFLGEPPRLQSWLHEGRRSVRPGGGGVGARRRLVGGSDQETDRRLGALH